MRLYPVPAPTSVGACVGAANAGTNHQPLFPNNQSARERVPQLRGPVTIHHSPIPKQATNLVMVPHFEKN